MVRELYPRIQPIIERYVPCIICTIMVGLAGLYVHTASQSQTGAADADIGNHVDTSFPASGYTEIPTQDHGFLEMKFQDAFGASLVNSEGVPDSATRAIWWDAVSLRGKQYALPDGNAGSRFVNILADEIESCNAGRQPSEREFIFTSLVLQRNKAVRKAKDIRPMLMRRMDMWEGRQIRELLPEDGAGVVVLCIVLPLGETRYSGQRYVSWVYFEQYL